jgi:hypothetical protein
MIPKDRCCIKCGNAQTGKQNRDGRLQARWHRHESGFFCTVCYDRNRNKTPKRRSSDKAKRHRMRKRLLELVGRGKINCIHCGCDRQELLEINHINGGGTRENAHPGKFYHGVVLGRRGIEDLELRCNVCNALHYLEMKYGNTGYSIVWDN